MKTTFKTTALLVLLLLSGATWGLAQPAVYFTGNKQCLSFSGNTLPDGNRPRTVEFWLRSDFRTNAFENHESLVELGTQTVAGSAFGIFTERKDGKTYLSFWGHNRDQRYLAVLPDREWHFVAVSYDGSRLRLYLDGLLKSVQTVQLNTARGTCYIGGKPERKWYFNGAIRGLSVWNDVRSAEEIARDMVPFHGSTPPFALKSTEPGLVCHFPLNEGRGTQFRSLGGGITGNFVNGPLWTKAIGSSPDPIDEGIWFYIQNKSDIDTDFGQPARRMALGVNDKNQVIMAPVPYDYYEDPAAFLWRTVQIGRGVYKLVNMKLGLSKALDCSQTQPTIGNYGNYTGQQWKISPANTGNWGTNVYTLSNSFVTDAKALQYSGGRLTIANKTAGSTAQAWLIQPAMLHAQYHFPLADAADAPFTKKLSFGQGFLLHATNTSSDWATLNSHLVYKNYLNAMVNPNSLTNASFTRKEVNLVSRRDSTPWVVKYKLNVGIFDQEWWRKYRGGSGNDPARKLSVTFITEEMMCKTGVYSRIRQNFTPELGVKPPAFEKVDIDYRGFDQVVHEFSHAYDMVAGLRMGSNPLNNWGNNEWFPWQVQYWFNSAQSEGPNKSRQTLSRAIQTDLAKYFKASNTWLPPRNLHEREPRHLITSGTVLKANQSYPFSSKTGVYELNLQSDGNVVISHLGAFRYGTFNNMGAPMKGITSVKFENGYLYFLNSSGSEMKKLGVNAPGSFLIFRLTSKGVRFNVLDEKGNVLYCSP